VRRAVRRGSLIGREIDKHSHLTRIRQAPPHFSSITACEA
jgi:hypothetical protein